MEKNNHEVWIGIERFGNQWFELNGQRLNETKVDWAPNEPTNVGNCAVASQNHGYGKQFPLSSNSFTSLYF